jgi:polyhydroxyalkanoate synthesis regulator phasin
MKLGTFALLATVTGASIFLCKKLVEHSQKRRRDPDSVIYARGSERVGEKVRKASMFAVGAVKTSADKIAEGFRDMKNIDLVQRGEETVNSAKDVVQSLKEEIDELKSLFGGNKTAAVCECGTDCGCECSDPGDIVTAAEEQTAQEILEKAETLNPHAFDGE